MSKEKFVSNFNKKNYSERSSVLVWVSYSFRSNTRMCICNLYPHAYTLMYGCILLFFSLCLSLTQWSKFICCIFGPLCIQGCGVEAESEFLSPDFIDFVEIGVRSCEKTEDVVGTRLFTKLHCPNTMYEIL